jgi:hypothetical protein
MIELYARRVRLGDERCSGSAQPSRTAERGTF